MYVCMYVCMYVLCMYVYVYVYVYCVLCVSINDLNISIQNSKVYHFADDTNLLRISTSYKKLQKELNKDLKNLNQWLLANKISLNETKTEIIHFHKINCQSPPYLKIKMNGKLLHPWDHIKYLDIYLDETLW